MGRPGAELFAFEGAPDTVLVVPRTWQLVRHEDIPGCPGCRPGPTPCLATDPDA